MELKTVGGYKSGVALSTVIISPFNNQILDGFFQQEFKDTALEMISGLSWYLNHWLSIGSTDKLQDLCNEVIAHFDTEYLEKSRKSFRQMKELLKKTK
ncbi:MAG: hypothetical protein HY574_01490 [candidate division NC10 bacterium]|nr:hypothetical protein [candidate division NC10 bacterium]